jgi:hypothetical protein
VNAIYGKNIIYLNLEILYEESEKLLNKISKRIIKYKRSSDYPFNLFCSKRTIDKTKNEYVLSMTYCMFGLFKLLNVLFCQLNKLAIIDSNCKRKAPNSFRLKATWNIFMSFFKEDLKKFCIKEDFIMCFKNIAKCFKCDFYYNICVNGGCKCSLFCERKKIILKADFEGDIFSFFNDEIALNYDLFELKAATYDELEDATDFESNYSSDDELSEN